MSPARCHGCGVPVAPSNGPIPRKWCSESCRKHSCYSGACVDCGAATYNGGAVSPERCIPCAAKVRGAATKIWTRPAILAAIRRWADTYGEPPAVPDWSPTQARQLGDELRERRFEQSTGYPTPMSVIREFGSWNAAIAAAGFPPRARYGGGGNQSRRRTVREKAAA